MLRRATSAALAFTAAVALLTPAPAGAGPREERADLLLQVAELTDRLEQAEASLVGATLELDRAEAGLARARDSMRDLVTDAYVNGARRRDARSDVYLALAGAGSASELADYRAERDRVQAVRDSHERLREAIRGDASRLESSRRALDAAVAAEDARRAADEERADRARAAANAARAALVPAASLPAAGPYDPAASTPRHRRATEAQLALMGRLPFGPTPSLPSAFRPTGQTVEGVASWYGPGFHGRATASGAIYDQEGWTVASRDLPLGTFLWITRGDRGVVALVNDRGPYVEGRVLDLSRGVSRALGFDGIARVRAEVVVER